jgi:cbb3-type cytochrome oxidase subunit 3
MLATSPMLVLPLIALVLFMVVFTAIIVTTMKKRATALDSLARIPLEDGEETKEGAPR